MAQPHVHTSLIHGPRYPPFVSSRKYELRFDTSQTPPVPTEAAETIRPRFNGRVPATSCHSLRCEWPIGGLGPMKTSVLKLDYSLSLIAPGCVLIVRHDAFVLHVVEDEQVRHRGLKLAIFLSDARLRVVRFSCRGASTPSFFCISSPS